MRILGVRIEVNQKRVFTTLTIFLLSVCALWAWQGMTVAMWMATGTLLGLVLILAFTVIMVRR